MRTQWKQAHYSKRGKTRIIKPAANDKAASWLVERVARVFWTNRKTNLSENKAIPDHFRHSVENYFLVVQETKQLQQAPVLIVR